LGVSTYILVRTLTRCSGFRAAALSSAAIGGLLMLAPDRLPAALAFLLVIPASLASIVMDQTHYHSIFRALRIVGGDPRLHATYRLGVAAALAAIYLPPYALVSVLNAAAAKTLLLAAPPAALLITYLVLYAIERAVKQGWRRTIL